MLGFLLFVPNLCYEIELKSSYDDIFVHDDLFICKIQALQHWWKKDVHYQGNHIKNKSHLVTFHKSVFVSLQTFQATCICVVLRAYNQVNLKVTVFVTSERLSRGELAQYLSG